MDLGKALKPRERQLAELMCLEPTLRNIDYAERIGIGEKTVYVYKNKPEFQEYLSYLCNRRFRLMEAKAMHKLDQELDKSNFKAIQYVLDGLGYKAKEQQEIQMDARIEIDYGED